MNSALQSLCLFLTTGRTYTFRDVSIESDNETAITFRYLAMSDGQHKRATFFKEHIAGISRLGLPVDKPMQERPAGLERK